MNPLHARTITLRLPVVAGVLVLGLGLLGPACGEDDARPLPPSASLPPVSLGAVAAFVETAQATAFLVDPAAPRLQPRLVPLGKQPVLAARRTGKNELLVLSRGVREGTALPPEAPSLTMIPADPNQPPRRFPLAARFDRLTQSPDGRFAVLTHERTPGGAAAEPDPSLLFNPNEISVLDLDVVATATPSSRSLRSFGGVPQAVYFSPPLTLRGAGGRSLRLAVVFSDNYLTLFDLENDRTEITVSLTRADERRTVSPVQVLFEAEDPAQDPTLFVRSTGSNDVVALRLVVAPPPLAERANDFRPVLSLLSSGGRPSDMALIKGSEGPRLLLLTPDSSEASVIDPVTSRAVTFKLDAPADRLVLFEAASPAEPARRPRALLLSPGSATQVGFLDLDRLEELRGRNVELRAMGAPSAEVLPLPARGLTIVKHRDTGRENVGLSVIDLERRTISPLVTTGLRSVVLGDGDDLWLLPSVQARLGRLELGRLAASEVRLDRPVTGVLPLEPSRDGRRFLMVNHSNGADGGAITFLDADKFERSSARSLVGFFYSGVLERRAP